MKNLKLTHHRKTGVSSREANGIICKDLNGCIAYVDNKGLSKMRTGVDGKCGYTLIEWSMYDIQTSEIIGADVIAANNNICVVTKEGDVITVCTEKIEVEVSGSVSAGIEASCWSPDQELLVLITGDGNVIIMTADFDPITEFPMSQDEFGENRFVNVGWGKKETQFHGTAGKQAAKAQTSKGKYISEHDDHKPRISWRGDGQLFVYSYVEEGKKRVLRTVSREGILQYTSEDVDGLEHALSWKPSGSLIASSQRLANKVVIAFFEKNGLKHGEFTVPYKPDEVMVKEVLWNQDSSILLVWLKKVKIDKDSTDIIQLWTSGNYHWYLKQEREFAKSIVSLFWDMDLPLVLHVLTENILYQFSWVTCTDISKGHELTDLAQVAVVDGPVLKITPFRQSVVPPPMSSYEVTFKGQIHAVLYAPSCVKKHQVSSADSSINVEDSGFLEVIDPPGCSSNNICVIHGSNEITFLIQAHVDDNLDDYGSSVKVTGSGGNGFNIKVKVHRVIAQHEIDWEECRETLVNIFYEEWRSEGFNNNAKRLLSRCPAQKPEDFILYNWTWAAKNTILVCFTMEDFRWLCPPEKFFFCVLELENIGSEAGRVVAKSVHRLKESAVGIAASPDGTVACLQLESGTLLMFDLDSKLLSPYCTNDQNVAFPSFCQQMSLCPLDGVDGFVPLGLTNRNRLYMGNEQLLANCTSYHIHTDHLLGTTTNHFLQVIPLSHSVFAKLCTGVEEKDSLVGTRKIERGSRIVTAISQDTRVILQMPRGNLEMVSPRPLAVHILKSQLNKHNYHTALDMMRKQRIDLNLLYDHNPEEFMTHATLFVQSVNNAHWLDLFLASLNEADVTKTMYSFNYDDSCNSLHSGKDGDKINCVCNAIREAMTAVDEEGYLLPILTSYIKMNPCQIDVALRKVKDMKDTKGKKFKVSAEEGLRHLLYISDVNELYDVALGTYDFDLVMMVAEKSQKDPKEYLPFLNGMKQLEENYMKFKINVHLRKYGKALECLKENNDHQQECLDLVTSQKLYKEALLIFPQSSDIYKDLCEHYGNFLMSKEYNSEAAIMYTRAELYDVALKAYQQAGNWKMVMVMTSKLQYDREKVFELCNSLVDILKDRREFVDAAVIYEEYLKNEEEAVECLVKACQWNDALRIAYKHNRSDLVDTNIQPGVLEQYEFCTSEIERFSDSFTEFVTRLVEVRKLKEKQHLDFLEGKDEAQLDSDLYSDTSTVTGFSYSRSHTSSARTGSSTSGKSHRSSKSKRKLERKKYSTKKGSAFEDLGLVTGLHEIMVQTDQMASQITSLTTVLVIFGMDEKASCLQSSFTNLLSLQARHEREIWPAVATSDENDVEFGPQLTTEGAINLVKGSGIGGEVSLITQRMKTLQPHLQHAPQQNRSSNWSLHMLRKDKL